MIVIAAVDDNMGMMFNHRRQSRDRLLRRHILELAGERPLWMDGYSAAQFGQEGNGHDLRVDEDFLSRAGRGEFCFLEDRSPSAIRQEVEQVILLRWNRRYPADQYFDLDLTGWSMVQRQEFPGSSHERITQEVYVHE